MKAFADYKINVTTVYMYTKSDFVLHMLVWKSVITSILSFSHDVLAKYHYPKQALVFTCLQYKSFENTLGKGEIAPNDQFFLFPQCFLSFWRTLRHFHQILNWKFGKV